MYGNLVCITALLLGVDAGWQPLPEGGVEYLIQIEPELLDALKAGEVVHSDIPPNVQDVRAYRISVGKTALPRQLPLRETSARQPIAAAAVKALPIDPFLPPPTTPTMEPDSADMASPFRARSIDRLAAAGADPRLKSSDQANKPSAAPREAGAKPGILLAEPTSRPIAAEPAAQVQPAVATSAPPAAPAAEPKATKEEATKPWFYLTLTLFGLFASMGGNLYAGWLLWDMRSRYHRLLSEMSGLAVEMPGDGDTRPLLPED